MYKATTARFINMGYRYTEFGLPLGLPRLHIDAPWSDPDYRPPTSIIAALLGTATFVLMFLFGHLLVRPKSMFLDKARNTPQKPIKGSRVP